VGYPKRLSNSPVLPQWDFVDRGHYSLETVSPLLVLKAWCVSLTVSHTPLTGFLSSYPDKISLLRGNHDNSGLWVLWYAFLSVLHIILLSDTSWRGVPANVR
jgi:hypothetical protein